jgi:hypothetical protein
MQPGSVAEYLLDGSISNPPSFQALDHVTQPVTKAQFVFGNKSQHCHSY